MPQLCTSQMVGSSLTPKSGGESLTQRGGMTCAMRHSLSLLAPELGAAVFSNPTSCSAAGQPGESRGCSVSWPGL